MVGMRLRHLVVASALALSVGVGVADPAFAAVPAAGSSLGSNTRAVVVIGVLAAANGNGTAALAIDVGRRHPVEKRLAIVTNASTVITKGGRAVRLSALPIRSRVTVVGKRSGDRIIASRISG